MKYLSYIYTMKDSNTISKEAEEIYAPIAKLVKA